jgi:Raf kinase inhibitor-like YbhB/YbcL family protein
LIFYGESISLKKVANMKTKLAALLFGLSISHVLAADQMRLESASLRSGGSVPTEQVANDCGGKNRSPALAWSSAPAGTKSFAITLLDLDAPGGNFWHWVVFDLSPQVNQLPAGASTGLPANAKQTLNDYGKTGYGGPCPPPGSTHRYILTVYALDADHLPAATGAAPGQVAVLAAKHALAKATITVRYGR